MEDIIISGLASAAISTTLTRSILFRFLKRWRLFHCGYCVMHWAAWLLSFKYPTEQFLQNWFATVAVASLAGYGIEKYLIITDDARSSREG